MRLDYSVPKVEFLIGDFDCTDYLDSISLSQPIHEITQTLTWSGRFVVSFNRKARSNGLAESEFDQGLTPGRWRPNQVQVKLKIKGYTLPVLRIDRYAYNPQTGKGEGALHQILDAVATDRPGGQIGGAAVSNGSGAIVDVVVPVQSAVSQLLTKAFYRCTVQPEQAMSGGLVGLIYGGLISRNPVADAQKLAGVQWQWLTVDTQEKIRTIHGDPMRVPVLFSRSLSQIEWEPDIDHINFAASKVIVTGSHQQPAPIKCQMNPAPVDPTLDRKGRSKYQRVEEMQPANKVFTKGAAGNTSPIISEIKWVFYQYPDDLTWDSQLLQFMQANLIYERDAATKSDRYGPVDQPCQTVTVYQWPVGRVFSDQGTASNLVVAAWEVQSEKRKGRWVPFGVIDPKGQKGNLTLGLERYEDLKTGVTYPAQSEHGGTINPKTGSAQCLEPVPKKEERQPMAELPLETVAVAGIAEVSPANWTPIRPEILALEVGWLGSDGSARYLAQRIAEREAWRRDSVKVVMPIPTEWLAAGCPPLRRAYLHDGHWQIDGVILSLQEGEAKFAFTAARIDREGQPTISSRNEIIIRVQPRVRIDSATRPLSETTPITIRVIAVPGSGGGGGGGGGVP
jgi:hypothetical protein